MSRALGECPAGTHASVDDALGCDRCQAASERPRPEGEHWRWGPPPTEAQIRAAAGKLWRAVGDDEVSSLLCFNDGDGLEGFARVGIAWWSLDDDEPWPTIITTTRVDLTPAQMRRLEAAGWVGGDVALAEWLVSRAAASRGVEGPPDGETAARIVATLEQEVDHG